MGHRALHAVPVGGGRYDCVRTHWGALAVFEATFPEPPDSRSPVAAGVDAVGVLRALRESDEALFVHGEDTAYLVRSLAVPTIGEDGSRENARNVLVPVADGDAARRLDGDITAAREILGDAVDAGLLTRSLADGYLRAFVTRHPDAGAVVPRPAVRPGESCGKPPP